MRKLVSLLTFLCLLPAFAEEYDYIVTNTVGNLEIEYHWRMNIDFPMNSITIESVRPNLYGAVEVPGVIVLSGPSGKSVLAVSELADGAFANHITMTSVTLPSTLKRIGTACFSNCTSLAEVTIPYGIKTIGTRAFMGTIIQTIALPDTALKLEGNIATGAPFDLANTLTDSSHFLVTEDGAVYNKDQTTLYACPTRQEGTLILPESLKTIGPDAFYGCFRLTYLDIPETVSQIGAGAFNVTGNWTLDEAPESAPKLTKVFFSSDTPPTTDPTAFDGAPADPPDDTLIYVTSESTAWGDTLAGRKVTQITGSSAPTLSYTDAYNVTWKYRIVNDEAELITITPKTTSGHAVYETEEATSSRNALYVPATINGFPVTRICSNAFENCTALVNLGLPETLTRIDDGAFRGCTHLKKLGPSESIPFSAEDNAVTLPDGVTKLGRRVFEGLPALTVNLPHTVTEIMGNPAAGCTYVSTVSVASSNPSYSVLDGILYDRTQKTLVGVPPNAQLSALTVPSTVTALADDALYGCSGIQTLTLPASVKTLGAFALANCANLVSVTCCGDEPTADDTLYTGSSAELVTTCSEGFAGWSGSTWHERALTIVSQDPESPSLSTQVVNGVTFIARSVPAGMAVTGIAGYGDVLTIPRTIGGDLVASLDESALASIAGVRLFVSETPEIVVRNGCLYTPDYATLLRVPDAYAFTHTVTVTNTVCQRTVTLETYVQNGNIEYVGKVIEDNTVTLGSTVTSFNAPGTASLSDLLPESVVAIGPYAFYGCRGIVGTTHVITNGTPATQLTSDTSSGGVRSQNTTTTDFSVITSNHTFLVRLPAHVTRIATTAFDANSATLGVNTPGDPVIGDYYQTPAAVFNVADSRSPIVYPTAPTLSGTVGAQTISFRGICVTVPDYYTATQSGCRIDLALNGNARSEPTGFALSPDGNGIVFELSNVRSELYYAVKSQETLGGEWHYVSNARRGSELVSTKVELTRSGNSGFYTVEVTDTLP